MKKSVSLIITLCLVVLACVPSISVKAYEVSNVYARSFDSVQGYWEDNDYQTWQECLTSLKSSNANYETIVNIVANYRSLSGYPVSYDDFEHIAIFLNLDETVVNFYFFNWEDFVWIENFGSIGSSAVNNFVMCFYGRPTNNDCAFGSVSLSQSTVFNSGSWNVSGLGSSEGVIWHVDTKGTILYCDIDLFCFNDYTKKGYSNPNSYQNIYAHREELDNFMNPDLPYVNGNGDIVDPTSVSFSDTVYNGGVSFDYQQTHLYTEYNNAQGANETCVFKWALDSRSQSITQTTTDWKMHYYVVVNWHWTQATDSSVYTPLLSGGSGGQMAFEFDDTPEFIMQGKSQISIWDLVQTVPTVSSVRDEDIVSLAVAVSCLNGNIVNSVWKDIFGQSGQYVGNVASEIISGGSLEVQGVGDVGGSFINNLFNPAYYYALDDLRVNLVAHPWSETLGIHGGNGDFDLNLRSNESYGTTQGYVDDGGTPDNPSDDVQYPTNTVPQQNNVVVPVTYPTSGGNVTVYSVVQVPDSGGGGNNSINYSPTFSPSIVMDSGLDDLKETVDAYPQVPNKNFWDYFLVFKDNAFLDATSDFFGALPNELSSLLISSIGIIGVFAIYRFVRRR